MGNCFSPEAGGVQQRRGAGEARLRAWRATGIVSIPPGSREIPAAVFEADLAPAVKVLDATDCGLAVLPAEVGRLGNMTRLVLVRACVRAWGRLPLVDFWGFVSAAVVRTHGGCRWLEPLSVTTQ